MNCQQVQHHLDSWVRGELDGATGGSVAAHVAACELCRAEADLARHLVNGLRALRTPAPAALVDRIRKSATDVVAPRRAIWFTPLRALAAMLLVGVVVLFSRERGELMRPMNPSVVSAPQPVLNGKASPDERVSDERAPDERAPIQPTIDEAAGDVVPASVARALVARALVAPAPVVPAPVAPALVALAPVARAFVAPDPVVSSPSVTAPSSASAASTVSVDDRAKIFVVEEAGSSGGTVTSTRTASVAAMGYSAPAPLSSREPTPRSFGTKLFLRSLNGDDALGVTSFTQSQHLRSISRDVFRDTTSASLTNPYLKR